MIRTAAACICIAVIFCAACSPPGRNSAAESSDQAVIVELNMAGAPAAGFSPEDLSPLEDDLAAVLQESELGEFDGNEIAVDGTSATLYMYGPDADRLFERVEPTLRGSPLCRGAEVLIRKGGIDAPSREILL
jgi:hypothetical protein